MRLWHRDLLSYLPKSQLLAQKRECDLIWKNIANGKRTNHILINYIWQYDVQEFTIYYLKLFVEFDKRGFNFNVSPYYIPPIEETKYHRPYEKHHNHQYLIQCFYNLQEKYVRGQKDFDIDTYRKLEHFVRKEINLDHEIEILPIPKRVGDLKCNNECFRNNGQCPIRAICSHCSLMRSDKTLYEFLEFYKDKYANEVEFDQEIYDLLKARLDKEVEE